MQAIEKFYMEEIIDDTKQQHSQRKLKIFIACSQIAFA